MTLVSHFRKISQRVSAGISYRLTSRLRSQCQLHMRNGLSPVPAPQLPVKGWTTIHATVHQDRNVSQSVRSPRIRSSQLCLHSAVTTRWEGIRQETTRFRASGGMRAYAAVGGYRKHYETLAEQHYAELEVKKSKFLATAWPISSPEEALEKVAASRDPGASHNCWAYRVGLEFRSSDDGEPGGTAGRPILAAIEGEDLEAVCVMITRHFGGVKLGTGGLVRAYGGAARLCLQQAQRRTVTPKAEIEMEVPYGDIGTVYQLLDQHAAVRVSESYDTGGNVDVVITVRVEVGEVQALTDSTINATSGRVTPQRI